MSDTESKPDPNWAKYGLEGVAQAQHKTGVDPYDDTSHLMPGAAHNELFRENPEHYGKQWWKTNLLLSEPTLFGTWDGVFTSCLIHLFGVLTFIRMGWVVGNAGLGVAMLIVVVSVMVCTLAVLAGIGIYSRCHLHDSGGTVHVLISNVLGSRLGGAVSLIYVFGQAVSCALHVIGFAESLTQLLDIADLWVDRTIGVVVLLVLLLVNVAGVKWVVRLQFVLFFFLVLAALDFFIGVLVRHDPDNGVTGHSLANLRNNWHPAPGQTLPGLFHVFGVFFPAATGVMAGINMSADLFEPRQNIPLGTLTAIGTSFLLYLSFAVGLAATCVRSALLDDYMIAQKASAVGVCLVTGLFMSTLSYSLGSLYASPRIMQNIASENIIPVLRVLAVGRGPNKVPVNALVVFSLVTLIFTMIGQINVLAPIVTIPYLLTYATVEYAYFSLAMTFDIQIGRESRFMAETQVAATSPTFDAQHKKGRPMNYGSTTKSNDLDRLFPERVSHTTHIQVRRQVSSQSSSQASSADVSPSDQRTIGREISGDELSGTDSSVTTHDSKVDPNEVKCKHKAWYSPLINRWLIIFAALVKVVLMFLVQWGYALSAIITLLFLHYYIGQANPGVFPGISEFKLYPWLHRKVLGCFGRTTVEYGQMVVPGSAPDLHFESDQLTDRSTDFGSRQPYHQSSTSQLDSKSVLVE